MAKTMVQITLLLPHVSISRYGDMMTDVRSSVEKHKGEITLVQMTGPISDGTTGERNGESSQSSDDGGSGRELGRSERSRAARDAFDSPDAGSGSGSGEPAADAPRRRGRPSNAERAERAAQAGASAGERSSGERAAPAGRGEGAQRNEPERTREGSDTRSRQGEGRSGSSERGRDDQRGNREAARIEPADDWGDSPEDWADEITGDEGEDFHAKTPGDDWPDHLMPEGEIDKTVLSTLLGDHYKATGGKDRSLTFEVMENAVGTRQLGMVNEADYDRLARALLKDTARYRHGIKKPK
jgi:hypothetical protein